MFNAFLVLIYAFLLTGSLSIDPQYIDGRQYTIKGVGVTYTQRTFSRGRSCEFPIDDVDKKVFIVC